MHARTRTHTHMYAHQHTDAEMFGAEGLGLLDDVAFAECGLIVADHAAIGAADGAAHSAARIRADGVADGTSAVWAVHYMGECGGANTNRLASYVPA